MTFGQRLRELRLREEMTQRELAARVGVNHTYISKLETGHADTMPSLGLVWELADWLHTDRESLAILAGHIPDDIMEYLQRNHTAIAAVRRLAELGEYASTPRHLDGRAVWVYSIGASGEKLT